MMAPCKHLDHEPANYPTCKLVTIASGSSGFGVEVKYWERLQVPYEGAPVKVQFCGQGRGRINGIFQCYNPGEMHCYEPAEPA
jgi:hypothetical protein